MAAADHERKIKIQIIKTCRLTRRQKSDARQLAAQCRESDGKALKLRGLCSHDGSHVRSTENGGSKFGFLALTFPEDGDAFYLLYDGGVLAAVLAVCVLDAGGSGNADDAGSADGRSGADNSDSAGASGGADASDSAGASGGTAEVYAFTSPGQRRQGYFSRLLHLAVNDFEETDLLLVTDNRCPAAKAVLSSLGADFAGDEYMMSIALPVPGTLSRPPQAQARLTLRPQKTSDGTRYEILADGRAAGEFFLSPMGTAAYFFGFFIDAALRGRGLGSAAFSLALKTAGGLGFSSLLLQVSGENAAAIRLYERAGLRVCETRSYYLY